MAMHSSTTGTPAGAPTGARSRGSRAALVALALPLALLAGFVTPATPVVAGPADPDGAQAPSAALPATRPAGSIGRNPVTDRREVAEPDIWRTAVLIGDSQAVGTNSWPQLALRKLGYSVRFAGAGGTGFVAANASSGAANYYDSLTSNTWVLPHGDPALVIVEGGGNDAAQGASDGEILAGADALILRLKRTYPSSRFVLIGTLSRSARDGGGRRNEVDSLLGALAEKRGIPFVSAGEWLTTYKLEDHLADQVHLSQEGNEQAAEVLERSLAALEVGVRYPEMTRSARGHQLHE